MPHDYENIPGGRRRRTPGLGLRTHHLLLRGVELSPQHEQELRIVAVIQCTCWLSSATARGPGPPELVLRHGRSARKTSFCPLCNLPLKCSLGAVLASVVMSYRYNIIMNKLVFFQIGIGNVFGSVRNEYLYEYSLLLVYEYSLLLTYPV